MPGGLFVVGNRPFSFGSQYSDWSSKNCANCIKGAKEPDFVINCDIEQELLLASFEDGYVTEDVFKRMGAEKNEGNYNWICPERQET